ncbi:MAG TPA: alpha-glucan family phosphorylase [Acidimicrobiia bacterium]|nr:alpha-glucan family phosphorylase [Acidimicrobiia bacterium]
MYFDIPTLPNAELTLPRSLRRLSDLAYNLWWSWHPEGRDLWASLDQVGWEQYHNPIDLLEGIDPTRWRQIEQVEVVHDLTHSALAAFDLYMEGRETWYDRQGAPMTGPVAYLCTEFGVHNSLPFYSGGLGILAGDHLKSASDLGIPLVAVGLLFRRGYFRQEVDMDGDQQHFYPELDLRRLPVRPVSSNGGGQLKVTVELPGREVYVAVWKLDVGGVPLLLLDTDLPENNVYDRPITHQLYVSGREMRFCQELVLGIGGVRALDELGIDPAVWHVNEGHSAMSVLERAARAMAGGGSLDTARSEIRRNTLFTLHTPVPAGNEVFDASIASKYLGPWAQRLGLEMEELTRLASPDGESLDRFDLGALAIRFASIVNGVSKRHGEIATRDWSHLIGGEANSVTNGVHTPSWIGRDGARLLTRRFGSKWPTKLLEEPSLVEEGRDLPDDGVWEAHLRRKEIFARFARGRIRRQLARHGGSPDELAAIASMLPTDRLTLGFARRFATYKRATLMFRDIERLHALLTDPDRPIQIVFAGKAHPADQHGQDFIRHITEISKSEDFRGHVFMLEAYDARIARFMVQGVDVWANNPRPPMEASGTSGMKAAINGTLNFSVLDGWWLEGYNGANGWVYGSAETNEHWDAADHEDAEDFYRVLAEEIAPLYYERNADGIPERWIERMKESVVSSLVEFSTHRMLSDYCDLAYFPLGRPAD